MENNESTPQPQATNGSSINRFGIGANVVLQLVFAAAIAVGVNYVAFKNTPKRWDLSRSSKYALAPQTEQLMKGLEKPVNVIVFSAGSPIDGDIRNLLREMQYRAGNKLTVEYLSPFTNVTRAREVAQKYKVGAIENSIILDVGGNSKVVSAVDMAEIDQSGAMFGQPPTVRAFKGEQVMVSTILELTESKQSKLYLLTGHGEPQLAGREIIAFKAYAERQNVKLDQLNLINTDAVPADATGVMIFGAKTDLTERELQLLSEFWSKNGRLFVLLEPTANTPRLNEWLGKQGIKVNKDAIVRTGKAPQRAEDGGIKMVDALYVSPNGFFVAGSPLTKDLEDQATGFLGRTCSLEVDAAAGQLEKSNAFPVVQSGEGFWAESEFPENGNGIVTFDPAKDKKGPLPIIVAAEKGGMPGVNVETSRLVAAGNARWLTDQGLQMSESGIYFATNALNWLFKRENLVGIPAKEKKPETLKLEDDKLTRLALTYFIMIPGAVGFLGLAVWFRRR